MYGVRILLLHNVLLVQSQHKPPLMIQRLNVTKHNSLLYSEKAFNRCSLRNKIRHSMLIKMSIKPSAFLTFLFI